MKLAAFIDIEVVTHDGNKVYFKTRELHPLQKLMHFFCEQQGVSMNSVSFLFDGDHINETQTPKQLKMKDGDILHVHGLTH